MDRPARARLRLGFRHADALREMLLTENETISAQAKRQIHGIFSTARALGRRCGLAAVLAMNLSAGAGAVAEDTATPIGSGTTLGIATWGGAYGQSQETAYF